MLSYGSESKVELLHGEKEKDQTLSLTFSKNGEIISHTHTHTHTKPKGGRKSWNGHHGEYGGL